MKQGYFAVGTALYEEPCPEARVVATATSWLLRQRNEEAVWGGEDQLDRFITTNHVAMTLLALGFSPDSRVMTSALSFLANLDQDKQVSFYWRSATFLNLSAYAGLVASDAGFVWKHRRRIGVHKDYPIPFFLLKLLRFAEPPLDLPFRESDVLEWILDEWNEDECWYNRTSITSMALALIHDLDFHGRDRIVARCCEFIAKRFSRTADGCGRFSDNLVDDCFTVFNLCERPLLKEPAFESLEECVDCTVRGIVNDVKADGSWESGPPFGGAIGPTVYPTAVAIRALMSFCVTRRDGFRLQLAALMLDAAAMFPGTLSRSSTGEFIWGEIHVGDPDDLCFVLMPFERKLTDIYERYVKTAVTKSSGLRCERADDVNKPNVVMRDVWDRINRARIIVADLTGSNANVFYELGLAHALGKRVILIVQRQESMPFDVSAVRAIVYDDTPSGYEQLSERIVQFINEMGIGAPVQGN